MSVPIVDACVHPFFRSKDELRDYLAPAFKGRGMSDVESGWYQAPGGDYREDLYADGYPGSDPAIVAAHVLEDAELAILNPLTRGNLPDYHLTSAICSATNDWLVERWLEGGEGGGRFRGTIRVNPEDPRGAVAEIERLAAHPLMVQVGVPLQSQEPYGRPRFDAIWAAAAEHGLPVAVAIDPPGAGAERAPTPAGHPRTYAQYAAYMPLNYFVHLSSLAMEGVFERHPELVFVFADGGGDLLTPMMWRLDTLWFPLRDQTPWVSGYPSEYLRDHVRLCTSALDGTPDGPITQPWLEQSGKEDLLMFASHYPFWHATGPAALPAAMTEDQREKLLWRNAERTYRLAAGVRGASMAEADPGGRA